MSHAIMAEGADRRSGQADAAHAQAILVGAPAANRLQAADVTLDGALATGAVVRWENRGSPVSRRPTLAGMAPAGPAAMGTEQVALVGVEQWGSGCRRGR